MATRIEAATAQSDLIRSALELAREAHAGQTRKDSGGMPYIEHPTAVAELLATGGFPEETVAAALLHDVVEDSEVRIEEIEGRFGPQVARLVEALTDRESIEPYEARKAEHRRRVEAAGGDALAIYAADKLTNIRALRSAYAKQGEAIGEELVPSLDVKVEVWRDDLEMLRRTVPDFPRLDDLGKELTGFAEDRRR